MRRMVERVVVGCVDGDEGDDGRSGAAFYGIVNWRMVERVVVGCV